MIRGFVSRFPWRMVRAVCIVLAIVGMSAIGVFGAITNMAAPRVIAPGAPIPIVVATPAAPAPIAEPRKLPCKQQSWPMIDRSCESWTADARKVESPTPEPAPQQVAAPTVPLPSAVPQPSKVAVPAEQPKRTAAVEPPKAEPPKPAPAAIAAPRVEPPKVESKTEPKTELGKTELAKVELATAKIESAKVEPAKVEPEKTELPTAAPTEVETAQAVPLPRPRTGPRSKPETTRTEASAEPAAPKDTTKTEPKLKLADNAASTPAVMRLRRNPAPANVAPANAVPAPFPIQEFLAARR